MGHAMHMGLTSHCQLLKTARVKSGSSVHHDLPCMQDWGQSPWGVLQGGSGTICTAKRDAAHP